jgi:hypothetical protein
MKILALERENPGALVGQLQPHLKAEARKVWELVQKGVIRELYFSADRHEAVLIMECADAAEAQNALAELPLVQSRLITFDIIPLVPYSGFERLFAE